MTTEQTVTRLLHAWRAGDRDAIDRLLPLVYAELRRIADRQLRDEADGHTLQPTALVHEAFLRLSGASIAWEDRVHFFAIVAGTMRRLLVDHAKARRRAKRGGGAAALELDEALHVADAPGDDVVALDEALERLATRDARKARVVELHYFVGLTQPEIAEALSISVATVERDLRFAKAWLYDALADGARDQDGDGAGTDSTA